jgi:hypothetical protein
MTRVPRLLPRSGILTLAAMIAAAGTAYAAPPTPRVVTKAAHNACERRAAKAHDRHRCPHTTPTESSPPPDPYADYHAPTGPLLSPDAATARADTVAALDGDASPTVASVTLTTVAQEQAAAAASGYPVPDLTHKPSAGYNAYLATQVYVVVLDGQFTMSNAQLTPGLPAPSGNVLRVIVDARGGQVAGSTLLP